MFSSLFTKHTLQIKYTSKFQTVLPLTQNTRTAELMLALQLSSDKKLSITCIVALVKVICKETVGKLTLSAVFCPPKHRIIKQQFSSYFKTLGSRFIAGGEYNAKHTYWGSRLISPKGRLWTQETLVTCLRANLLTSNQTGTILQI